MLHAIVMAGGSGTRFWPASRAALPKQLLPLAGERTLLEDTVARLEGLVPPERVLVVTSARLLDAARRQLPQVPESGLVGEPCKRDTAPCIGLAALLVSRHDPDATMAVMPSDHVIAPAAKFQDAIRQAAALVEAAPGRLVTFGIRPTYPAESFGYIQQGAALAVAPGAAPAHVVARFREKPPAQVAAEYLAAGDSLWNAGIFVWKAATILAALRERQPDCLAHLERIAAAWDGPDREAVFAREFAAIKGISIDYAVLEHAADVVVIEAPFTWDDLGGWSAVARQRGVDAEGNTIVGRHLGIDSVRTIVHAAGDHLVVTMGLEDMLVVHTPDATLVADRTREETVRKVVAELEQRGWQEYL
ncbi:MAG: NTP transferase domain-containing protein [Planctomycetaceae bacterium]|nr:NTP transferase domain-containing protein [Planctomycetaceae bacterium]